MGFRSGEYAGRYSTLTPLLTRSMKASKEREMNLLRLDDLTNPVDLVNCAVVHDDNGIWSWEGPHLENKVGYERRKQIAVERTLDDHAFNDAVIEGYGRQDRIPVIVSEDSKRDRRQLTFCPARSTASCMRGDLPKPRPYSSNMSFCRTHFHLQKRVVQVCNSLRFEDGIRRGPARCAPRHAS